MKQELKPSSAQKPDLDWSQIRETVMMLNLAVSQIAHAMKDGDESVTELANLFTSMVGNIQAIGKAAENMAADEARQTITTKYEEIMKKVKAAIVAFQFYDQLSQRLNHVCHSLTSMADLIGDPKRLFNPYEWYDLQQMIKARYTSAEDRYMFEAIINGSTVEEAVKAATEYKKQLKEEEDGNVELF